MTTPQPVAEMTTFDLIALRFVEIILAGVIVIAFAYVFSFLKALYNNDQIGD